MTTRIHIDRLSSDDLDALYAERDHHAAAVQRVRDLHRPWVTVHGTHCAECSHLGVEGTAMVGRVVDTPCPTLRALDAEPVPAADSAPAPTTRAGVLREAIDLAREEANRLEVQGNLDHSRGARCVAYLLRRRLAKEQPAAPLTELDNQET